ncbi:MAG: hypothetical protein CMP10_15630 [Zetaproteobacteria bacterium]|nr:hypothetical protein [Pseudobdellovibrionaceae bacterium]
MTFKKAHGKGIHLSKFTLILFYSACSAFMLMFDSPNLQAQISEEEPAYSLAQGCYILKSQEYGRYIAKSLDGFYQFDQITANNATHFFLKPTGLGSFLLHDDEGRYLSRKLLKLKAERTASESANWRIHDTNFSNSHTVNSINNKWRLRDKKNSPILGIHKRKPRNHDLIEFIPQKPSSCLPAPEASINAEVAPSFYEKKDPDEPIIGFADMHTHIGFPQTMAGLAMSGGVFHPFGIEHALHDCEELHGENGNLNLLENNNKKSIVGYNTAGYPNFSHWPNRETSTHITAYYRWLERTYLSGLRLMVTNVTGNPTFCQLLSAIHITKQKGKCSANDAVKQQVDYIYQLQDYIDAQEGGPGQGWFRIVKSPEEARKVIADQKLAVVLGLEHGALFDCSGSYEVCTPEYIDQQLDQIHKLGIRSVFPIHRFDNDFGGTKLQKGTAGSWMHLTSKMSTSKIEEITDLINPAKLLFKEIEGYFYDVDHCPEGIQGSSSIKSMREFIDTDFAVITEAMKGVPAVGGVLEKFLNAAFIDKLKPLPEYTEFQQNSRACNTRSLQTIGRKLLHGLIDRGMIIEGDHMSYSTYLETLSLVEERKYSGFVSSHGWYEGIPEIRERIFRLGGVISPFPKRPADTAMDILAQAQEIREYSDYTVAMAIGTDVQGVATQGHGDIGVEINYPFKSYDGHVTFTAPQTGNRSFNFTKEGVAHYGLMTEWVENLIQVNQKSEEKFIDLFMNSAEAYVQMWERAANHRN